MVDLTRGFLDVINYTNVAAMNKYLKLDIFKVQRTEQRIFLSFLDAYFYPA